MSVIMHGNHYSIVFLNSWDVSGAMENVWNEDLIFTKPPSSVVAACVLLLRNASAYEREVVAYSIRESAKAWVRF